MSENNFKTIKKYFEGTSEFIIPNYQRGFKWGVPHGNSKECSISILMDDLIGAFNNNNKMSEYFLQGVTVCENDKKVTLVDGQQRTTTLYLLLSYLSLKTQNEEVKKLIINKLNYTIRSDSNNFLNNSNESQYGNLNNFIGISEKVNIQKEKIQDIYYFKKAIITIHKKLTDESPNIKLGDFCSYLLNKVKIIYIVIPEDKAVNAFSMLNGLKAVMTDVELIKSKLLSKASRNVDNLNTEKEDSEWEIKSLRSRYAREWDKWLYWWKRKDVLSIFKNDKNNPLQLLLDVFYLKETNEEEKKDNESKKIPEGQNKEFFKAFEGKFLTNKKDAKNTFLKLRKLQKRFEDWFNNDETYNAFGLIFNAGNPKNKFEFFDEIINDEIKNKDLWKYAKWSVAGVTYYEYKKEIKNSKDFDERDKVLEKTNKVNDVLDSLSGKYAYFEAKENANKQLLRMNVELDNKLKRKFNFAIYEKRSLEHIHAKSGADKLDFENKEKLKELELENFPENSKFSVHCIGNLVLLYKNDNSSLGAKIFEDKKKVVFNDNNIKISSSLLHTLNKFSKSKWTEEQIKENYYDTLIKICDTYELKYEKRLLEIDKENINKIPEQSNEEIK